MHGAPTILVRLLATACLTLAGCGGPALLRQAQPLESSRPLAEGKDERILASIETVILRNGPGAWARDAEWDEYLIRIRALSDEPVEIRELAIFDTLDHRIESHPDRGELVDGTRETERRYRQSGELVRARMSNGWVSAGVILAGTAVFLGNGAAAIAAVANVVGVSAGANDTRLMNNAESKREIKRRATTFPVALPRDAEASVDLFFPITPRSRRTQVVYADRHGEHRLDIDTRKALAELELQVDPPPTVVSRQDPRFPDHARRQGIDRGYVIANLALDRHGHVQGVEVIESVPRGVFTPEARRTFGGWIYNEGRHDSRIVEATLEFKR